MKGESNQPLISIPYCIILVDVVPCSGSNGANSVEVNLSNKTSTVVFSVNILNIQYIEKINKINIKKLNNRGLNKPFNFLISKKSNFSLIIKMAKLN